MRPSEIAENVSARFPAARCLLLLAVFGGITAARAITQPKEVEKLLKFKETMIRTRGDSWAVALESWTCPEQGECDPW